ncbi:MAG TPA: LpxD N-terminal domain-containing protein, partial [Tahibacter sp.]|nr:LpxD N-terminal domain-containing protein [Tahibacter sp.]
MSKTLPSWRLADLAERFGLERRGDGDFVVRGVATLAGAGADQLSFLSNPLYRAQMQASAAGVVVLRAVQRV